MLKVQDAAGVVARTFDIHTSARVSLKALPPVVNARAWSTPKLPKIPSLWRVLRTSRREVLSALMAANVASGLPLPSCGGLVMGLV